MIQNKENKMAKNIKEKNDVREVEFTKRSKEKENTKKYIYEMLQDLTDF
jgi:hypothetical protein